MPPLPAGRVRHGPVRPRHAVPAHRHPVGQGDPGGKVAPGNSVKAKVARPGGVPASGVTAVVLNMTATRARSAGYLQVYPHAWGTIGGASNLNLDRSGQTVADLAVVPVGADGMVAVYDQPGSQVIIDVFGYFTKAASSKAGRYQALNPARIARHPPDTAAPRCRAAATSRSTSPVSGGIPPAVATRGRAEPDRDPERPGRLRPGDARASRGHDGRGRTSTSTTRARRSPTWSWCRSTAPGSCGSTRRSRPTSSSTSWATSPTTAARRARRAVHAGAPDPAPRHPHRRAARCRPNGRHGGEPADQPGAGRHQRRSR